MIYDNLFKILWLLVFSLKIDICSICNAIKEFIPQKIEIKIKVNVISVCFGAILYQHFRYI